MKNKENIINWLFFISLTISVVLFLTQGMFSERDSEIITKILGFSFLTFFLLLLYKLYMKSVSRKTKNTQNTSNTQFNKQNLYQMILMNCFKEFEKKIKSKNDGDFPCEYWYNIVMQRSGMMKNSAELENLTMQEVHDNWIWSHCDEYINKYYDLSHEEKVDLMVNRLDNYSFIFNAILELEKKVTNISSQVNTDVNPLLDNFDWDKISISSSYYGCVKYALSIGMTEQEIIDVSNDLNIDFDKSNGTNPYEELIDKHNLDKDFLDENGQPSEAYIEDINKKIEQYGLKFNKRKGGGIETIPIKNNTFSTLEKNQKFALFFIFYQIANSDGITESEHKVLQEILLELEITSEEFIASNIDGNQAVELLLNIDDNQKKRMSEIISLVVGADGEFSADELIWVNDVIKELDLDLSLVSNLMSRFWVNKN